MKKFLMLALFSAGLIAFAIKCDDEAGDSDLFLYNYACCHGPGGDPCDCSEQEWGPWHKGKDRIKSTEIDIVKKACDQCKKEKNFKCCTSFYKEGDASAHAGFCDEKCPSSSAPKSISAID